jgi:sodium transport system permease protein
MNWTDIRILYLRELRSALRERSIVVNTVLIPILMYPVMLWLLYTGITFVNGQTEDLESRIAIANLPERHAGLHKLLADDKTVHILSPADPQSAVRNGQLDAAVEFFVEAGDNFRARITYDESRDQSVRAKTRVEAAINKYKERFLQGIARSHGLNARQWQAFWIESKNISSSRQMGQFILGLVLPLMLIVMLAIGAFHPAIDSTAGERENSTWETVMTLATSRVNIVAAKYLYVATMAFVAGMLNLIAMTFSMRSILSPLGRSDLQPVSFSIPPASIPVIVLGAILMALFVAAGMMILASFARSYKEGQSLASPFYIALVLPILFMQAPGQEFTLMFALVPVVNIMMMFREAIQGTYRWPLIGVTVFVELISVAVALRLAVAVLHHEDFVTGTYAGTFGQFLRKRLLKRAG